ncbi:MAG TPA: group 1 truncated hemoglobin [Candidatus Cybelea sp.]|nr:group 1 truncated hemoglobin [Candidatus Cybelea sp.]
MRGIRLGIAVTVAAGAMFGLAACKDMMFGPPPQKSLYDRLGGQPAINAVVDDFVANVAADPVINARFKNTDIAKLKQSLRDQICAGTGGPCTYKGKDMVQAHKGMNVSNAEFNAMGGDMLKTLNKLSVPDKEKNEVMTMLGSMQASVVGH